MSETDLIRRISELERRLDDRRQSEAGGWQLVEVQTLAASATSVSFSSIPAIYGGLILLMEARTDRVAETDSAMLRFNGDSGNNYDYLFKRGQDGNVFTAAATLATNAMAIAQIEGASARASNFAPSMTVMLGYANSDREKWTVTANSGSFGDVSVAADLNLIDYRGRWRNTATVTSITLFPIVGPNFVAGSRFRLYGIL